MTTEDPKVEMTEEPKEPEKTEAKADTPAKSETELELERTRDALKKANKEAAERRKRLEELEAKEKQRAEAEMTEAEKMQTRLKELEAVKNEIESKLKQKEYEDLQLKTAKAVAKKLEIPFDKVETFVTRLRGNTEEELAADAELMFAVLKPQEPEKPKQPKQPVTNPGPGEKGETKAQVRARTLGVNTNIWQGGTVKMVEKE